MDSLYLIYHTTLNMYRLFWEGRMPSQGEVSAKLQEETVELIQAMNDQTPHEIADEIADVITVAIGAGLACGLSLDELYAGIMRVAAKNANKTHSTHKRNGYTVTPNNSSE